MNPERKYYYEEAADLEKLSAEEQAKAERVAIMIEAGMSEEEAVRTVDEIA